MTISVLSVKGLPNQEAERLLGVGEGTVRYHRAGRSPALRTVAVGDRC